jgi:hypothetical protein
VGQGLRNEGIFALRNGRGGSLCPYSLNLSPRFHRKRPVLLVRYFPRATLYMRLRDELGAI